jgi:hypothetical protein
VYQGNTEPTDARDDGARERQKDDVLPQGIVVAVHRRQRFELAHLVGCSGKECNVARETGDAVDKAGDANAAGSKQVVGSNSVNNISDRFPESRVVEYNYAGSSIYGDFDWESLRFVFDTEALAPTGRPALLAIVRDTWTI